MHVNQPENRQYKYRIIIDRMCSFNLGKQHRKCRHNKWISNNFGWNNTTFSHASRRTRQHTNTRALIFIYLGSHLTKIIFEQTSRTNVIKFLLKNVELIAVEQFCVVLSFSFFFTKTNDVFKTHETQFIIMFKYGCYTHGFFVKMQSLFDRF